jgi:2-amino-4-hydroxy-6-hydroxymethyldihydropteridine diphosphokinase
LPGRSDEAMRAAWLGLGGNIGDPVAAMARALRRIDRRADSRVVSVSPVYRTPPWGVADQPWFFNAAAAIRTRLEPEALLDFVLDTEVRLKRVRRERWGPRIIDIDVLAYEGFEASDGRLTLPHPRMTERAFVMVPLADVAPELVIHGKPVAEWAKAGNRDGIEIAIADAGWWRRKPGPLQA